MLSIPPMHVREIEWRSPLDAFAPLAEEPFACLFHPGERAPSRRWSTLCAFPASRLVARGGEAFLDGRLSDLGPFEALAALHRSRRAGAGAAPIDSSFLTGLAGFAGYELGGDIEPAAKGPLSPYGLPDLAFGAYDASACFDRAERRCFVLGRNDRAIDRLTEALGRERVRPVDPSRFQPARSNFSAAEYRGAVASVVAMIADGTLFQANISQRIEAESVDPCAPFLIFVRLAEGGAPFGAFLCCAEGALLSNSPERFFRVARGVDGWRISAEPIKGTRPRDASPEADAALAEALIGSAKDRAENVMIADLTRNDLSRICDDGSISEDAICELVSTPDVHHLVSRISGRLRHGLDSADALSALFPCGSVTGAPKIEAMRTIAAIERVGRGPYCGAIGYIDDRGGADFSVAIRIMIAERHESRLKVTIPVGGGVTLRSDPDTEYQETLTKARASLAALGLVS